MLQILRNFKGIAGIGLVALNLCACQGIDMRMSDYFANHSKDYLVTGVIAPLDVPEGHSYHVDNCYPLPECLPAPGSVVPPPLCPPNFENLT